MPGVREIQARRMDSRLSMENASPTNPVLVGSGKTWAPCPAGSGMLEAGARLYAVGGGRHADGRPALGEPGRCTHPEIL